MSLQLKRDIIFDKIMKICVVVIIGFFIVAFSVSKYTEAKTYDNQIALLEQEIDDLNRLVRILDDTDNLTHFPQHIIEYFVKTQLLHTVESFYYYNNRAKSLFVGENEIPGNCVDYAIHFVVHWNDIFSFTNATAYLILYSEFDYTARGIFSIDNIKENTTRYEHWNLMMSSTIFYSVYGDIIYEGTKVSSIPRFIDVHYNHAWVLILTDEFIVLADPQYSDDKGTFIYSFIDSVEFSI